MIARLLAGLLFLCSCQLAVAQNDSIALANEAAEFEQIAIRGFAANKVAFLKPMLPTLADCRAVFKAGGADLVYLYCKNGIDPLEADLQGQFVDLKTAHYTTAQLKASKEFLASNKRELRDHLLPDIRFYQVTYFEPESQLSLRYFVKLDGRWVYFSNPWRAFVTQD